MARGINQVILLGRLGADPFFKKTDIGALANVSLATSNSYRDKKTNQIVETTEWHKLVFFNKLAEIVNQYLTKGSQIYASGRLRTRKYKDKNQIERYATEIIVQEIQMLGGGTERADKDEVNPYQPKESIEEDNIPF